MRENFEKHPFLILSLFSYNQCCGHSPIAALQQKIYFFQIDSSNLINIRRLIAAEVVYTQAEY